MRKISLILSLSLIPFFLASQNSWVKKESLPASKRVRSVAFAIANRGYLCCGEDSLSVEKNDLWEYDPGSNSWTQKVNLPGPGRRDAVGFSIGTKGYVGTGIDAPDAQLGNVLTDFWQYDPVTNTWTARANYPGASGSGVYSAASFVANNKGYVCCGKIGPANYSQELWEYNPSNNVWSNKPNFPGGPRYGQMSFAINNKGYVGCGTDPNWFTGDFWEFNPSTNVWTPKADFPGSARAFGSAFALGPKGYMGMGEDGGYCQDWFEYDVVSDSWNIIAPYGSEGRRSAPTFVITGAAYVMTGKGVSGKHRDLWQYQPYITGMEEFNSMNVNVYPNPASEIINFDLDENFVASTAHLSIQLLDVQGKIISEQKVNGNTHVEMHNENWAAGIYMYSLTDGTKIYGGGRVVVR